MKNPILFGFLWVLLIPGLCFGADPSALSPNGSGSDLLLGGRGTLSTTLPAPPGESPGIGRGSPAVIPKDPAGAAGWLGQGNAATGAPDVSREAIGIDREGRASVLTRTPSGGYLGIDGQGNASMITPIGPRGDFGVDGQGNVWTIAPPK